MPDSTAAPRHSFPESVLEQAYLRSADGSDVPTGAASAHLALGQVRAPGSALIRVYRPGRGDGLGAAVQVVTDDMPLLVESVMSLFARLGVSVGAVVHPVLTARRDRAGTLEQLTSDASVSGDGTAESWMHIQLHPTTTADALDEVESELERVLADVRQVAADTGAMRSLEGEIADELDRLAAAPPGSLSAGDLSETAALLRWLARGNFNELGYRRYEFADRSGTGRRRSWPVAGSGLGVLRGVSEVAAPIDLPADVDPGRPLLVLTQGVRPSTVHRSVYPYFVGVAVLDDDGVPVGEHRFLGVLTVTAMHENILDIPLISRRVREVIARAGIELTSYTGQQMLETMQTVPRAELFSMDTGTLYETVTSVVEIRRQVRLFVRVDSYGRYLSCLVYLPRDRYTTRVRLAMQDILLREYGDGVLDYTARVSEGDLALLHVTIRFPSGASPQIDISEQNRLRVQAMLAEVSRSWTDRLADAAATDPDFDPGLVQRYAAAVPEAYKEDFDSGRALADLRRLEPMGPGDFDLLLYRPDNAPARQWRFTLYIGAESITLGRVLPVLQSLGVEVVDERPYQLTRSDGMDCFIYDFGLNVPDDLKPGALESDPTLTRRFTDMFATAWCGDVETDRFNELVLRAGLTWRQVLALRAYAKYLRQTGFPYSQYNIEGVLLAAPETTALLVELFEAMFDPAGVSNVRERELVEELTQKIDAVTDLTTDRILRALFSLVCSTLRTNYFVPDTDDATRGRVLALKLDPAGISELPRPRPKFEVFVYAPDVEGVHMRFGAVARGGLRWSDRREDFRTEVLGLVKAQAVKNAVIVPVGAKGGFVVKHSPPPTGDPATDRQALRARGEHCYRRFIAGLLDITDNLDRVDRKAIPPERVVRRDGDDTYLVVAADKGTASFSDLANSVAAEYDFWLGDAFASGGSAGYDHKEMGITARGAWESVKRHFLELGIDTQTQDFTAVGIGDMSGDVFGNGMLLSEHIRLVAAFDHRHIFLDPDPDATRSFAERCRLFALPRSSWADYDAALISSGGGVWDRTRKSIAISAQARAVLDLPTYITELTPPELIRAILRAPVDLLWNGGIGTYIKASSQSHADVGDKSNDAVRVDGADVRARVVGEGGNLGVTQSGRIEYARSGGKINTDAIDNSAGVDCSDHEVNIKILLDSVVTTGNLPRAERNPLLESMTDEVAELVLADNISQNNVLGLERAAAPSLLRVHQRLITALELDRGLDRALEALPDDTEIEQRLAAEEGLTSPELSQLLAHVKLALVDDLLETDLPDSDTFSSRLPGYFPAALRTRFRTAITAHPLRRQIVATVLANDTVDHGGITYVYRLAEETGASSTDAIRAYAAVTEIIGLPRVWQEIRAADVPTDIADDLLLESRRVLDRASRRLLSTRPQPLAVGAEISRYRDTFARLAPRVGDWMRGHHVEDLRIRMEPLLERGAPAEPTGTVFRLLDQFPLLDVIDIADIVERDEAEIAELYYALDAHIGIDRLLTAVSGLARGDRWHSLARLALRDELYGSLRSLVVDVVAGAEPGETCAEMIEDWELSNGSRLVRARSALEEIFASGNLDLATLSVAARQIRSMVRTGASDRR
ncbi:NAD-glutamate dehydrogenase [Rhodococcus chondri]|uniref:NAD-glutamate dehydrogenase n=1 Tax=Rhodococcus chondri TaxID=3065941 RepID=A0ABU7JPB4_9NOCA|nr:NAD-glutamate dehydrogenase [Rhodococcus sp. CC-R104]MEE2031865.1 NAD-glutamate dehydrogenase [Rhodococcus sp. CC-R104]